MKMSRPSQANRYQQNAVKSTFTLKGVYVARLLVCIFLALDVVLISSILYSSKGLPGFGKQNQQVEELESKILRLRIENQRLFEMIQTIKTSSKAQEKLVRRELGWVHDNEIILESSEKTNDGGGKGSLPIKPFNLPR